MMSKNEFACEKNTNLSIPRLTSIRPEIMLHTLTTFLHV